MKQLAETNCRLCNHNDLNHIISFGEVPLTAKLLTEEQLFEKEELFSLDLDHCPNCSMVQVRDVPSADKIFDDEYPYYSSHSISLKEVSKRFVTSMISRLELDENSLVTEIACNDGYLLEYFIAKNIPVLGIDPASGPAKIATDKGINVLVDFFSNEKSISILKTNPKSDLVIANNVLAHLQDINGFVAGMDNLLTDDGVISIEVGDTIELFNQYAFDTIYHEHHSYFTAHSLNRLLEKNGLKIFDIEKIPAQGASMRVLACKAGSTKYPPNENVKSFIEQERKHGLFKGEYLQDFSKGVENIQNTLITQLESLKKCGFKIAGYAASAKGIVMLNSSKIGKQHIDFIVDKSPEKQNRFMPGSRIPILGLNAIKEKAPDYLLVLSWNLREEIIKQESEFISSGGKLIFPLPKFNVFDASSKF